MDRDVTGASRALGKYCWEDWDGVTMRSCFNCMAGLTGGCEFRVWELVRRAMG